MQEAPQHIRSERESICTSQLTYTHDYSTNLFCLNVYAMQS